MSKSDEIKIGNIKFTSYKDGLAVIPHKEETTSVSADEMFEKLGYKKSLTVLQELKYKKDEDNIFYFMDDKQEVQRIRMDLGGNHGKNEYYVIVDIRTLEFMRDGYGEQRISDATVYATENEARYEIETYDEPQYFEVYKVEQEISRNLKLVPKIQSN